MPKRSKKSKSKRITLKQKHKVIKKVKDHHKKKAKEAKKLGLHKRPRVEKDPGIPNDWPFKEQELKALEVRRAKAIEEIEQKKAARKERAQKRKLGLLGDDDSSKLADAAPKEAIARPKVQESGERIFYRELVKVIEASDVILEVLDARDPLGTRCIDMEKMTRKAGPEKQLVLLLNKIDLVPRESVEKWLKYLRVETPTVAFKCSTQEQKTNLGWKAASKASKSSDILQTGDCLGAETLLKLLKNYSRSHEIKKSITVGVIGLPNVGKSSLINSLKRCRAVNVGATPGLTKALQEVQLDKDIKLIDCPGVVMLKSGENDAAIALRNCKKIEKLTDPIAPVTEVLKLCSARLLVTLYKIPSFDTVDDFLQKVATVRGKLKKGGIVDVESAARIVLRDWNEGKIQYYTMPPSRNEGQPSEARIVSELANEFNVDEVYTSELSFIGSLKSSDDLETVEIPPSRPLYFADVMEDDVTKETAASDDEDESMTSENNEATEQKLTSSTSKQNKKLYAAEGNLNSKLQKAERKRRKKGDKPTSIGNEPISIDEDDEDEDSDYDFKVDYQKKVSFVDLTEEENSGGEDDDNEVTEVVPMSGVEVDN